MPVHKITPSARGRAAIASVAAAMLIAASSLFPTTPPAVALAVEHLIKPWEGLVLTAHYDRFANIWDICYGETRLDGKPVQKGMTRTKAECERILAVRVQRDYYEPLRKCITGFDQAPISVQAMLISGAYNFGTGAACLSTAGRLLTAKRYGAACIAMTAFNKAGKGAERRVVKGLVNRREMGDATRIGEAELCVSGL